LSALPLHLVEDSSGRQPLALPLFRGSTQRWVTERSPLLVQKSGTIFLLPQTVSHQAFRHKLKTLFFEEAFY